MTAPTLLTVPEACALLRCSRSALYDLMRTGELPSLRVGRSRRIRLDALEAFLDRAAVPPELPDQLIS